MCKVSLLFLPLFLLGSLQSDCTLFKLCAGLETKMLVCGRNIILRILFSLERRKYVRRHWKAWSYVVCYVLRADLSPPVDMVTSNMQVSPHTFGESIFCVSCCVPVFLIMCKKRYPSSSLSPSFFSFSLFLLLLLFLLYRRLRLQFRVCGLAWTSDVVIDGALHRSIDRGLFPL